MSEEQKEYEAMKLVELMHQLQKCGVIQPAVPGDDGKPVAATSLLEMREVIERMSNPTKNNESTENPTNDENDGSD